MATRKRSKPAVNAKKNLLVIPDDVFEPKTKFDISAKFSARELRRTEKALGVRLPLTYVELLKKRNGGFLFRKYCSPIETPPENWGPASKFQIESISGIHRTHENSLSSLTKTAQEEWGVPNGLIAFCGDGHYWVCLDYRECGPTGEPCITQYIPSNFEGGKPEEFLVARSFEQMLRALKAPKPGTGSAGIALDSTRFSVEILSRLLANIGCNQRVLADEMQDDRMIWDWPNYRGKSGRRQTVLVLEKNHGLLSWAKFKSRKHNHLILRVDTSASARKKSVQTLLKTLGRGAVLLALDSHGWEQAAIKTKAR